MACTLIIAVTPTLTVGNRGLQRQTYYSSMGDLAGSIINHRSSRLYRGIHIQDGDLMGRENGSTVDEVVEQEDL